MQRHRPEFVYNRIVRDPLPGREAPPTPTSAQDPVETIQRVPVSRSAPSPTANQSCYTFSESFARTMNRPRPAFVYNRIHSDGPPLGAKRHLHRLPAHDPAQNQPSPHLAKRWRKSPRPHEWLHSSRTNQARRQFAPVAYPTHIQLSYSFPRTIPRLWYFEPRPATTKQGNHAITTLRHSGFNHA